MHVGRAVFILIKRQNYFCGSFRRAADGANDP